MRNPDKVPQIAFRKAGLADVAMLRYWDSKPHVMAAAPHDEGEWLPALTEDPPWRAQLIAELAGRPIGFVEIIDPAEEETHYWGEVDPHMRAIDIWIGEEADLGKGYGSRMMKLALLRYFQGPAVQAVLIDPLRSHVRAHRFYERIGFEFLRYQTFGPDDCKVYQMTRTRWEVMGGSVP